jgi:L-iditol 2-dehydrogenase
VTGQAEARPGETAVVLGAGTVGLAALMALRVRGVTEIYVTDLVDSRLRMAEQLGARVALDAGKTDVVKRGGRVLLAGFATEPVPLDLSQLIFKEASIHTSRRYRNLYPTVVQAMAEGLVSAMRLVTGVFPFTRIARGNRALSGAQGPLHQDHRRGGVTPPDLDGSDHIPALVENHGACTIWMRVSER